ncbi:hypothetical protein ACIRS3_34905 [Streptomyces virginiae]|uniref:hypothetical protein n=1 Tax=Streptomyces virginiae TaxID=1961 RepID=UPI003827B3AE
MPVSSPWPAHTIRALDQALAAAAKELSAFDARVEHYPVSEGGYADLTGTGVEVFSLEARIGPAHRRPGYSMWGVLQVFDPAQPNLALIRILERRDHDGMPEQNPLRPQYGAALDRPLCGVFLPVCNRALAALDPAGQGVSQHVVCFHGRVPADNLLQTPIRAAALFRRFRTDGQKAIIWADIHDPLTVPPVRLLHRLISRTDTHLIPRTTTPSTLHTSLRLTDGTIHQLGGMSTAIDDGLAIARHALS